ncbi:MAG: methylated-DNA--[protein]-cysteine S-methyltransferase [Christensenellales bacterium]|jgi:methylated-DNA-[protein]-cysteine S-methyltransferase
MNSMTFLLPGGWATLIQEGGALTRLVWNGPSLPDTPTPLLREAGRQLAAYFSGSLRRFTLPLAPKGTPFQTRVWRLLGEIPYGETRAYGEIAAALGRPSAARAVGGACHANPLPLLIPCHRVTAKGGPGGYAPGPEMKIALLALEKRGGAVPADETETKP